MQAEEENPETTTRIINRPFIINFKGGEEMKKKRKGSEEELNLGSIRLFDYFISFLELFQFCPPEWQREMVRVLRRNQTRVLKKQDRFLQKLIQSVGQVNSRNL